jgi:hypothetical protein
MEFFHARPFLSVWQGFVPSGREIKKVQHAEGGCMLDFKGFFFVPSLFIIAFSVRWSRFLRRSASSSLSVLPNSRFLVSAWFFDRIERGGCFHALSKVGIGHSSFPCGP